MNSSNLVKEKNIKTRDEKNSKQVYSNSESQNPTKAKLGIPAYIEATHPVAPIKEIQENTNFANPDKTPPKESEIVGIKKEAGFLDDSIASLKNLLGASKKNKRPTHIPQIRDALTVQIEHIMEEGLQEAYKELSPVEQQEFKIKGEETAWEIRALLRQAKIKIKKIFQLLVSWLKLLPGINRFFLEQEAKIKVDKIISLKNNKMR